MKDWIFYRTDCGNIYKTKSQEVANLLNANDLIYHGCKVPKCKFHRTQTIEGAVTLTQKEYRDKKIPFYYLLRYHYPHMLISDMTRVIATQAKYFLWAHAPLPRSRDRVIIDAFSQRTKPNVYHARIFTVTEVRRSVPGKRLYQQLIALFPHRKWLFPKQEVVIMKTDGLKRVSKALNPKRVHRIHKQLTAA